MLTLAAVATGAVLASGTAADPAVSLCRSPDVVGVSLAMARHVLGASGCHVAIRQLPAHDRFVTPEAADSRQLVAQQSPGPGARTSMVTVALRPLCSQPAMPGPAVTGPISSHGPTRLVAGLFLAGGPPRLAASCRAATPSRGTLTISSATGRVIAHRAVRPGNFGVFPLHPGSYLVSGTLSPAAGTSVQLGPVPVSILSHRTTRLNVVGAVE